jgi:hypothetical protein
MARPERWATVLWLWSSCFVAQPALAKPPLYANESRAELGRVEIALVGDSEQDPVLFERIRSLFSPQTAVVLRSGNRFDPRAVLRPERADTVYLWLRVTRRTAARVYLALREEDGSARYLFREVKLEAGLDEVGSETLAQVAHSSAQALWLRERQTSRQELVAALEHEDEPPVPLAAAGPSKAAPASSTTPIRVMPPASNESSSAPELEHEPASQARPTLVRFALGASYAMHASGGEGWLHEPGAFLAFEYRDRVSLRLAGRYLVPTEFDTTPARVRLSGASGELRAGWLSGGASRPRVRLEMGLGFLLAHAEGSLAADEPKAHVSPAQDFERTYALGSAAFEWPLGPLWLAAAADLRVPFHKTFYEVGGQSGASESSALSPGGTLELGMGFEPAVR